MFWSSDCSITQIKTSKTTQKWLTEPKTKLPVLWPEPCRRWMRWTEEKKHRHGSVNLKGLEWFWMKEWSLISCQVFSDLNPVEDEWTEEKKHCHGSVNLKGLEWFWMKEWSLISCQVFSDLNPVEDEWTEEKKHRHGSVNLKGLEWFWMKEWSLISCQVFSNLIRYYRRTFRAVKLANRGFKKYFKKGAVNSCGQCVLEKYIYFIMILTPPPHFKLLLFNERLHFYEILNKRIKNAD